jgi:hypothetical protein
LTCGGQPSGYGDHALQYGAQFCGVGRADGYFEFLLRPPPVRCGGLETGLTGCGEAGRSRSFILDP